MFNTERYLLSRKKKMVCDDRQKILLIVGHFTSSLITQYVYCVVIKKYHMDARAVPTLASGRGPSLCVPTHLDDVHFLVYIKNATPTRSTE